MKRIIPFKKRMNFKTNVNEITSIALENTLHNNNQTVEGDIIINGTYKITETSTQVDEFEFKIPMSIEIDKKYDTENMKIEINDFYYEVINDNILEVNIEILLDNIIEIEEPKQDDVQPIKETIEPKKEERCIEEEIEDTVEQENIKNVPYMKNIFENFKEEAEEYSTYHIYIVREGDTLEKIMTTYNITKEKLSEYNNTDEIKLGDKIIIPEQNVKNQ